MIGTKEDITLTLLKELKFIFILYTEINKKDKQQINLITYYSITFFKKRNSHSQILSIKFSLPSLFTIVNGVHLFCAYLKYTT